MIKQRLRRIVYSGLKIRVYACKPGEVVIINHRLTQLWLLTVTNTGFMNCRGPSPTSLPGGQSYNGHAEHATVNIRHTGARLLGPDRSHQMNLESFHQTT